MFLNVLFTETSVDVNHALQKKRKKDDFSRIFELHRAERVTGSSQTVCLLKDKLSVNGDDLLLRSLEVAVQLRWLQRHNAGTR